MAEASRAPSPAGVHAVIPAAGRGTRMAGVTRGSAKELLPVGGRPLIVRALEDLAGGGIRSATIVLAPGKDEIARVLGETCVGVVLDYALQQEPDGVAAAFALAEPACAGRPFVGWLPDNCWLGTPGATAQLLAAARRHADATLVGLVEHRRATFVAGSAGGAGFVEAGGREAIGGVETVVVTRVMPKGSAPPAGGETFLKGFPLVLWQPTLFARIAEERARRGPGARGELDDTPFLIELAGQGALRGVVLRGGELHDCGVPLGYERACAASAST